MRLRIETDNALEIVGGGLLIAGMAVVIGLGAALITAAVVAIVLAEFSWAGKVWSVPLPTWNKEKRAQAKVRRQLKKHLENEAKAKAKVDKQNKALSR